MLKIDDSLFADLYAYHVRGDRYPELSARIERALEDKARALARRAYYRDMHDTAATPAERELARQLYESLH